MDSTDSLSDGKSPIDSASTPVENAPNGNASAGARLDDAKTSTPLPKDGHVSYALPAQSSTSKSPSATVSNPILVNKRSKEEKKKKKKGKRKGLRDDVPAPTSVEELQARLDEQPEDAWLYDADVQAEESLELDASGEDTAWEHRDGTSASSFVDNHAESVNIPMAQFDHGVTFARTQTMASIGSGPESLLKRRDTIAFIPNGFLPHVPGAAPGLNLLDEELLAEKQAEGLVSNSTDRPESVASASSPINVTVTSYTPTDLETQHFTSLGLFESFLEYTEDKDENLIGNVKPVRWIHVEGIDLALLRALALRYGLHPLAIEDLTTFPPHVKLDFYSDFMFLNCMLVTLDDHRYGTGWFADARGLPSPEDLHAYHKSRMAGNEPKPVDGVEAKIQFPLMYMRTSSGKTKALEEDEDPRDKLRWCNVAVEPVAMFLHRSGTLISIFANEANEVTGPIMNRLKSPQTLLRKAHDPSFLMEALLDGMVDRLVQVASEYADELEAMERKVFKKPKQGHTRQLHLILLELHALRRVVAPFSAIIDQLRQSIPKSIGGSKKDKSDGTLSRTEYASQSFKAVSRLTQFYLADVSDHVKFSIEEFGALEVRIQDLSTLIVNTISHEQNSSMKLLAIVSMVFLPLTFVAGVYGMNFINFPEVNWEYGYYFFFFWCILSVLLVFIFWYVMERRQKMK